MRTLIAVLLFTAALPAQETASSILARVAANMDKAVEQRKQWVYTQSSLSRILQTNKKLLREERREYLVTPTESSTQHKLVRFEGKYRKPKDKDFTVESAYADCPGENNADCHLVRSFTDHMTAQNPRRGSRDGIEKDVFPLRTKDLPFYQFTLQGREEFRGRPVWRIAFTPIPGQNFEEKWEHPWAGEALIDVEDSFPLQIQSKLAPKIPFAVRTFLGTNLKQAGFSVTYQRVEPGVWFPNSYGTEFELDVVFFYKRVITLNMDAKDFRRATAESSISYEPTAIIEK